jgi:ABC-type oligopeptide transport system substrate-binding subunit
LYDGRYAILLAQTDGLIQEETLTNHHLPTVIGGRYELHEILGGGGMGVIYRAEDTLLERPVAIKFVSATGLGTEGRARFLQEARSAARLNHPNIVSVHDIGQSEWPSKAGLPGMQGLSSFIVMELVEGQTLHETKLQDLGQIIDAFKAICDALSAAHGQGIIHRDLKPENVAVTPNGMIKLLDFGLARISGKTRVTEQGAFMGTVSYIAPEIILGQEASPRSDLYAMGVMLYEMSAGRPPFEADNITAVISQHLHAPVVPASAYNEQIPPALDQLIIQLLSKRPEDRPETAEAVSQTLTNLSLDPIEYKPASSSQLNRLVRGRMVGRGEAFAEVAALWEKSKVGDGQMLLISGEPGIGKTRMVKELITYAELSGAKTLLGACYAQERRPYGPIAQMVQRSLEDGFNLELPQAVMADLLTLAPELRLRFPDILPNEQLEMEAEQQRLFESMITWFGALTADRQLLLIVEDAHWADSGSIALLGYLARRLNRRQAMVVATYREVELDEAFPFQELLLALNRERLAVRVKLVRLDKKQTQDLLATLFAEEVTPEFLDGIYRETEGNPFFVEEVCKALVDEGKLYFEDGRWQRPQDVQDLEIPQGVHLTIQSRLGKLSANEQNSLQMAALLGREFEFELLAAVTESDKMSLIDVLEKAESAQLIEEAPLSTPGALPSFTFTHALIHSTLLSNLSTLRRQHYQRQVALALEGRFPERREEFTPLLGRYFAEAGDGDKAITYLLATGDAARELYAYDEAIEAYEQTLIFLKQKGNHQLAARTLMKLGQTYHNIFAFDSAQQAYELGFAEWQKAAETEAVDGLAKTPAPHPFQAFVGGLPSPDPSQTSSTLAWWIINQLFSGLLQLTAEDGLVPDVAQSWEVLDEGRTYVFHLRNDVRWSDGQPVMATDFETSWKRVLDPDNDQGLGEILFDIRGAKAFKQRQLNDPDQLGIQAVDAHTLVVKLESPSSYFLQLMALAVTKPVPRHIVNDHGSAWTEPEKIVTNGPFTVGSLIPEQLVILERFEDYHGRFKGNLTQVVLKIAQHSEALAMYERNELDILYPYEHVPYHEARRFVHHHPDDYFSVPDPAASFLVLDVTRPPFDNARVRQALTLATDRETIANRLIKRFDFPATGGLVPPGIAGHVPGIALPFDPAAARQKLAEAGFPDGKSLPPVNGLIASYWNSNRLAEYLTAQWQKYLGLNVSFEAVEGNIWDHLDGDPPNLFFTNWWADYTDPDSFLRLANWQASGGWRNERYEALVEDARRIADQGQRMALYRQAEQILVEEAPIVPLAYGRLHVLIKPWVQSLPASGISGNILKDIVMEPH